MSLTFTESVTLVKMECQSCGIAYAVPQSFDKFRREDHAFWHCPNGHQWQYAAKSETEQLKEQLRQQTIATNRERENYFAEQRKHEQTQREISALRKRVGHGVCPCCQRTVSQLARHMKTKHPEFVQAAK